MRDGEAVDEPRIMALCAGYGGLEEAVTRVIGGTVVAYAETHPAAAAVFAAHHPGVPNLGDITEADWEWIAGAFQPTVIAAGFPCQDISNAGHRKGISGERSGIWKTWLRPWASYDPGSCSWRTWRSSGAAGSTSSPATWPHTGTTSGGRAFERTRWAGPTSATGGSGSHVLLPSPTTADGHGGAGTSDKRQGGLNLRTAVTLLPTPAARDWKSGASNLMDENSRPLNEVVVNLLPTPKASDGTHGGPNQRDSSGRYYLPGQAVRVDDQWLGSNGKDYGPVVRRWEEITGHPAPCPTEPGTKGNRRLNPAFSEWMMGIGPGHVTDIVTDRNDALHVIGNGVVPRQAEAAFRFLMDDSNWSGEVDDSTKQDKPRGKCPGCAFEYQLSAKGLIRKHNSRTGPGLCAGAAKPPREPETEDVPGDVIAVAPGGIPVFASPAPVPAMDTEGPGQEPTTDPDPFQAPGAASVIPDGSVSMQPEPDRDRWGRYLIHKQAHTRATTFAKAASSTFTLNEWQQRMTIAGMVLRPDLVALAHGLDVKQDRKQLNSIAEQAKEAAGQKVAANLGTAYHAFSERLDAGLITLADVPPQYRSRLEQYANAVRAHGLVTRPEWIERTVAVRADQVSAALPVAGTLDRIFQLPNGELVIGDLKTGADLSYGWGEIAVQLALYAHGVNTHGLFDWRTKQWDTTLGLGTPDIKVRTDFAIVMHLPAGGDGCTLHKVDLVKGWQRAQVCGQVMAMQADKGALSHPFTPADVPALPSPEASAADDAWEHAKGVFRGAASQADLAQLYQYAMESGKFHTDQLATLVGIGKDRLNELEAARV